MSYKNVLPDCVAQTSIAQESLSVLRYGSGMKYLNSRPLPHSIDHPKFLVFLKVFRFLKGF